jgi:hypothetical protein
MGSINPWSKLAAREARRRKSFLFQAIGSVSRPGMPLAGDSSHRDFGAGIG